MQLLKNILKAVISIGLLGYLIYEAEPSKIIQVYANVGKAGGYLYLLLAFLFWIYTTKIKISIKLIRIIESK